MNWSPSEIFYFFILIVVANFPTFPFGKRLLSEIKLLRNVFKVLNDLKNQQVTSNLLATVPFTILANINMQHEE